MSLVFVARLERADQAVDQQPERDERSRRPNHASEMAQIGRPAQRPSLHIRLVPFPQRLPPHW